MIALAHCKQEQCAAETSKIKPATNRGPKISLMFTPTENKGQKHTAGKFYFLVSM